MFRVLDTVSALGIPSDGWFSARNEKCLCRGSKLDQNVSPHRLLLSQNFLVSSRRQIVVVLVGVRGLWLLG